MSDLTVFEKRKLETLLGMGNGYVLNFSGRSFSDFFIDYHIDINAPQYRSAGDSKAKRLRAFWSVAPNHTVGRVLEGLIAYGIEERSLADVRPELIDACRLIAQRLLADQPVAELDSLTANSDDRDFEVVAEHVREAIEKNQPEGALDRLHTFVIKFIRTACEAHGIEVNRDKALHSIFGEYVKALREGGHLESQMAERILKSSISVLESFNDVRNNKSLAHDNPILNYEESLLIFNHVAASIRFIRSLELKTQAKTASAGYASRPPPAGGS
jgi:hypothetical protein